MNKAAKVVIVIMSIFTLLTLEACSALDKKSAEKITEVLQSKYGEEFVVKKIGGRYGTMTTNTVKAIVSPKNAPYKKFNVEMTKDFDTVWDDYMNVVMSEKLDHELMAVAGRNLQKPFRVKTYLTSKSITSPNPELADPSMPVKDYLNANTDVSIYFFIENESALDTVSESENIHRLAESVLKYGVKHAFIWVFYVQKESFGTIGEDKEMLYNHSQAFKYFSKKDISDAYSWVRIVDSAIPQSATDIKNHFK